MTPADHEKLNSLGYILDSIDFITTPNTKIWRAYAVYDTFNNIIKEGACIHCCGVGNTEKEAIENLFNKVKETIVK